MNATEAREEAVSWSATARGAGSPPLRSSGGVMNGGMPLTWQTRGVRLGLLNASSATGMTDWGPATPREDARRSDGAAKPREVRSDSKRS